MKLNLLHRWFKNKETKRQDYSRMAVTHIKLSNGDTLTITKANSIRPVPPAIY
ncbi:hypothetical protein FHS15_005715 [Paenibacillus castaneae]|nr:hypothetical protein [Paenibacillus castaneae]